MSFRLALVTGGVGEGCMHFQCVSVAHETKRIGFIEQIDLVKVAAGRVPNRFRGLGLSMVSLFRRNCRRGVSGIARRCLIGRG